MLAGYTSVEVATVVLVMALYGLTINFTMVFTTLAGIYCHWYNQGHHGRQY